MDFRAEYEKWCTDPYFDEATKAELKAIAGDDKEIEDRFSNRFSHVSVQHKTPILCIWLIL